AAVPRVVAPDPLSAMPRTQVRQIGAALVEVLRVAPAAPPVPPAASPAPVLPMPALVRLEISNGNGVAGAAARLARSLRVAGYQTVRLTNVKNFDVPLSRIEYQRGRQAMAQSLSERLGLPLTAQGGDSPATDMRIVLGRDAIDAGRIK
ncbi:MAG TPA: LytR C-terminal domain-containing protein, partial [Duganella sp.]|uniref:LytR C-terminal domain-containing protein n=1 Tax=Duganella sp. TaxID=1904440 RepID=UPI002ED47AE3